FYRALAWLELCAGNRPAAVACLERGVRELPDQTDLLTPLADLLVQEGDTGKVREILAKLEARRAQASQVKYLRARLLMREENWPGAIELLERLRTDAVSLPGLAAQVNLLLAVCHHQRGDAAAELVSLRRALAIDAANLSARMSVGNLHLNAGRTDEAIKEYAVVAKSPYAPIEAQVLLGRLRIAKARAAGAGEAEWEAIGRYVKALREKYPGSPEPALLTADMLVARKHHAEAVQFLREACARTPGEARLWARLAQEREAAHGADAAWETLDEAQSLLGDQVELRLARARLWAHHPPFPLLGTQGQREGAAERVRALEQRLDALTDDEQARLLYGLADLYAGLGDRAAVRRIYLAIAERLPDDVPVRAELFALALEERDAGLLARLKAELRRIEGDRPRVLPVLEAREQLATSEEVPAAVKERLENLLKEQPGRADVCEALAVAAEREGDAEAAAAYLRRAYDADRSRLSRLRDLLALLARTGKVNEATRHLREVFDDPRVSPGQFRNLFASVTAGLPDDRFGEFLAWLEPLIADDARARLWAGDLLRRRGQTDPAIAHYRAAAQLAPAVPDPYLHLAHTFADAGDLEGVGGVLAEAKGALPETAYYLLCANTVALVRDLGKGPWEPDFEGPEEFRLYAEASLRVLLARDRAGEAREILRRLRERADRPEDAAWAARNLALLTALHGSAEERAAAVRDLREGLAAPGQSPDDRRAQAAILALAYRRLDGGERREVLRAAIDAMKSVIEAPDQATQRDLFQLAQLYRRAGDREAYQRCLKQLLRREGKNLSYLTAYVDSLLEDNRLQDALPEVERLQKEFATDFRAVRVAAKYHYLTGSPERAVALAGRYVQAVEAGSDEGPVRMRRAAELLDELSQLAPGERPEASRELAAAAAGYYQSCLPAHPASVVPLVALLAREGRAEEAYDQLRRLRPRLSPRVLAAGGLALLRSGRASEAQFQTVKEWLDAALAKQPNSVPLRLSLAEFHTLNNDVASAERVYREVLEADPENIVALNNLAWVLAPERDSSAQARELIERAIRLAGPTGDLLDTRARVRIAEQKFDQAVEDLTAALGESETSLRYFHLAVARLKQSNREEALEAFRKARARGLDAHEIHPTDLPAFRALAAQTGG
ncbi:MAG TPA: tetratricopeptide repeat protein, partial [Gemmataceae bacterium]